MELFRSNPIQLSEFIFTGPEQISQDIQVLRTGIFFHEGQQIEIKKADLKRMVKNFKENVRGIDLMLDYSHESEKEAAAWFQDLYLSEDGKELWAKVDWTEDGAEAVRRKKYRYISADFNFAYKDNETLRDYGPTLLGAGLTNRPVVKKMNPTILSETKSTNNDSKENEMNFEEKYNEMKKKNEKLQEEMEEMKKKMESKDKKELSEEVEKREAELAEREEAVKLAEEKIEKEKKDAELKAEFDTMLSEGKAVEAQRQAFMNNDMAEFIKNAATAKDLNFSEKGNSSNSNDNKFVDSETPAQDEVIALAEKMIEENSELNIGDAQDLVLSENAELRKKYEEEIKL